ncbi:MAG: hypothetical protein INR65_14160 [Gluconacetobacter diazotrophicus]|nr:hypothetical protein [Gluconacetobacter diazotrophicus]
MTLPALRPPAATVEKIGLRLVRGGAEATPDALLLGLDAWTRWAATAPAVRLRPLRFAATASSALVLGQPLPPLPGARLVSREGVLVPAGWRWEPAVDPAVVRRVCGLRADELALWPGEDAPVAVIPAETIVPASRSAVRLTRAQLDDPSAPSDLFVP